MMKMLLLIAMRMMVRIMIRVAMMMAVKPVPCRSAAVTD